MAVLVTGGAGYIGSHVVDLLLAAGHEVTVVDRLSSGFREAVPATAKLVVADVADSAALDRVFASTRFDAVLHFAASLVVSESMEKPLEYYANNVGGTLGLLQAMQRHGVGQLVYSSTAAVYGSPAGLEPVAEDAPLQPISPYGASKLMGERLLQDTAYAHGLRFVALRYFNVAGADPSGRNGQRTRNATHLIKVAIEAAQGQRPELTIYGTDYATPDGTCVRDYIHVSDLADAHLRALDYLQAGGGPVVLNCGYGRGSSVREVVAATQRLSGVDFTVAEGARRAGDPPALVADAGKIRKLLNWQPRHDSLDEMIGSALAWEQRKLLADAA